MVHNPVNDNAKNHQGHATLLNAGGDVETACKFAIHPDIAFCTLIIVVQHVDNFGWYSIHQHCIPHGLTMHTVKGSRKINEDRNELLSTSDLTFN